MMLHICLKFWLSTHILKFQICSWLEFGIFVLVWILSLVFHTPMFQILAFILILKVQRTPMSFKSWFGALEDAEGSWLVFCILILSWIWSLIFDKPLLQILVLYLDFEGSKKFKEVPWSFGGHWRFLTGGLHLDLDLDMFIGHLVCFGFCYWFSFFLLNFCSV